MSGPKDDLRNLVLAGDVAQMKNLLVTNQEMPSETTIQDLLIAAAKSSHLGVLEFLLDQYPDIPLNEEIVRGAVNTGSIPKFKILLTRDSSIINMPFDKRGSPLTVACMGRQSVMYLKFLLEAGADPNQDPDAALFPLALVAALYHDTDTINLLLRHGARLDHSGCLSAAARLGNEPKIRRLLDRGARPENDAMLMRIGSSPLHVAVESGHSGVVELLLQYGADPTVTSGSGATALVVARQMNNRGKDMSQILGILGAEEG